MKFYFQPGILAVLIFACGTPEAVIRTPVKTGDITPAEIVRRNNANGADIRYLKSITTLNLESPKSANQFSSQIAIRMPDSVYIKIEGMLGIDGLKASLNRNTFVVYNIINKYVVIGQTSEDAIRKTFDFDASFDEMFELLTGLPRIADSSLLAMTAFAADESYYVMTFSDKRGPRKVWFDPFSNFAVSKIIQYDGNGDILVEKEFSRFHDENGIFFPKYVRVIRPKEKDLLSLYFDARSVNKPFNSNLFLIRYPRNVETFRPGVNPEKERLITLNCETL